MRGALAPDSFKMPTTAAVKRKGTKNEWEGDRKRKKSEELYTYFFLQPFVVRGGVVSVIRLWGLNFLFDRFKGDATSLRLRLCGVQYSNLAQFNKLKKMGKMG